MEIGYVNVFVSDLNRAVEFYKQKLGLVLEYSDHKYDYASFSAGPARLGLAVAREDQQELISRHTGVGLAVTDLKVEYARLSSSGVVFTIPPTKQPWGGFMALINDPDGNVFYVDQIVKEIYK